MENHVYILENERIGIPVDTDQTNLEATSIKILNKMKEYKISTTEIEACHRLGNKDTVVRFVY